MYYLRTKAAADYDQIYSESKRAGATTFVPSSEDQLVVDRGRDMYSA